MLFILLVIILGSKGEPQYQNLRKIRNQSCSIILKDLTNTKKCSRQDPSVVPDCHRRHKQHCGHVVQECG